MRAVMHVVKNRAGFPGFASTLHGVIYGKNQFTLMSVPSDPEFNLEPATADPQYTYCQSVAAAVLNGTDADPTGGAHYYENAATATSGWFSRVIAGPDGKGTPEHPFTTQIGHQRFYL